MEEPGEGTGVKLPRTAPAPVGDGELAEYTDFAAELARAAAPETLRHFRRAIEVHDKTPQSTYDPVTAADRGAEEVIRRLVRERYPSHGVFGEEHGFEAGAAGLTWVVDPIDGTRSFITGQLHWAVLVALYDGRSAIAGAVLQPYVDELFVGSRLGAWSERGGSRQRLATRACAGLATATLCATTPEIFVTATERAAFELVAAHARLVRYGGDCYTYCMLAPGLVDLVVEASLQPYDVQALIPLVRAAGGVMSDWQGGPAEAGGRIIAAGDRRVHEQALAILSLA